MLGNIGPTEMIFILVVLLLIFGAKRLPEIGGSIGRGIKEFKRSMSDIQNEISRPDAKEAAAPPQPAAQQPPAPQPPPQVAPPAQVQAAAPQQPAAEPVPVAEDKKTA